MDAPIDVCTVIYEISADENTMFLDALEDEMDILYEEETADEQQTLPEQPQEP